MTRRVPRIPERDDDAADQREVLLPDRVLDHDRHDVPALLEQAVHAPSGGGRGSRRGRTRSSRSEARGGARRGARATARACPFGAANEVRSPTSSPCRARARRAPERARRRRSRGSRDPARRHRGVEEDVARVRHRLGLRQPREPAGKTSISGRRSATTTTRGASSANFSRTMNSSVPRADDSRADAFQSIVSTSSPGRYGREPATSEPGPRRRSSARRRRGRRAGAAGEAGRTDRRWPWASPGRR